MQIDTVFGMFTVARDAVIQVGHFAGLRVGAAVGILQQHNLGIARTGVRAAGNMQADRAVAILWHHLGDLGVGLIGQVHGRCYQQLRKIADNHLG